MIIAYEQINGICQAHVYDVFLILLPGRRGYNKPIQVDLKPPGRTDEKF